MLLRAACSLDLGVGGRYARRAAGTSAARREEKHQTSDSGSTESRSASAWRLLTVALTVVYVAVVKHAVTVALGTDGLLVVCLPTGDDGIVARGCMEEQACGLYQCDPPMVLK